MLFEEFGKSFQDLGFSNEFVTSLFMRSFDRFGVRVVKIDSDNDKIVVYVTLPEVVKLNNANPDGSAVVTTGETYALFLKEEIFKMCGIENTVLKYRIRQDEIFRVDAPLSLEEMDEFLRRI